MWGWEEHRDHEMGIQNEYQNAYDMSRMEADWSDDRPKIDALKAQGRFCVVGSHPMYCSRTDALMGHKEYLVSDHGSYEEAAAAEAKFADWNSPYEHTTVEPRPVPQPEISSELLATGGSDEIPF